jgi:hypothetical protein
LLTDDARRRIFLTALCKRALPPIEAYNFHRAEFVLAADLEWLLSLAPKDENDADIETETLFGLVERARSRCRTRITSGARRRDGALVAGARPI